MSQLQTLAQAVVELGGAPLSAEVSRALGEVSVRQRLSLPAQCELRFLGLSAQQAEAPVFKPGSDLSVSVRGHAVPLFVGQVTAVEHAYEPYGGGELRVRGYDRLHQLRKRQPVRAHVRLGLADLMRELVADLGLTVDAASGGPAWARLFQHGHSDFELLAEAAERSGAYFTLRGDVLHAFTLAGTGDAVELTLGESLFEARFELNGELPYGTVSVSGWDPLRVESHAGSATGARVGREVSAVVSPGSLGGTGERFLAGEALQDDRQAEAIAQGELDSYVASQVTAWGVAEGDSRLRPGAPIVVRGVASGMAGRYVLTAVTHSLDPAKGFVSEFSTTPPPRRPSRKAAQVALGVVTDVEDPDGMGRVRVSLPTYNDVDTEWLGVMTAGAGVGKGLLALPDVGDTVLVLFINGDPAQGLVLGGLYGAQAGAGWDWGVEDRAVKRYSFVTPGGQRVRLDDARGLVRLENADGSFIEMSPEKVVLHARRRLEIEAPGQQVVIRGQKIDFERY